jgi:hypothetical protein
VLDSGSIAIEMTVSGNLIVSSRIGAFRLADRVAGDRMPHADDADDVPRLDALDLLFFLGRVNVPQLGDVFLLVLAGVEHAAVGLELARIDADPVHVARLGGQHFEHQAAERLIGAGLAAVVF